ncbi:MAG: YqaJ viral recombinase family protein [Pseudomonadota bacterium]
MPIERIAVDPTKHRAEWLALRQRDITASDVPAVCGEGMFGSPAKVWAEKRGLIPPVELNDAMKRGMWGEAAVFSAIEWEYPDWEVRRAKVYFRDAEARLGATPDGAVIIPGRDGVGIIQTKVIAKPVFQMHWLADPEDDYSQVIAPLGYQLQTLTESMLSDADYAMIAALVVDTFKWSLHIVPVDRNPGAEQVIRNRVAAFCRDFLDTGVQPAIDPERDEDLVKRLFPKDVGTTIDLSGDNEAPMLVDELAIARALKKEGEGREKIAKTALAGKLGENAYGKLADGRKISFKTQERGGYVVEPTSFRVMRVSKG